MNIKNNFSGAVKTGGLLLMMSTMPLSAAVSFTEDITSSLVGAFSYDLINDAGGVGTTIANFPHFHFDGLDNDGYAPGDTEFRVDGTGLPTISLVGEDLFFPVQSAVENYDTTGQPGSYPNLSGTFTSPFDGTTIAYSYTNVGFSSPNVFTGDFSFSAVPEPSSSVMLAAGFGFLMIRRKR